MSLLSFTGKGDTGAQRTVIKRGIAQQLGLKPAASVRTTGIFTGATIDAFMYRVRLLLPFANVTASLTAVDAPVEGFAEGIQGLIGRDLLRCASLAYVGTEDRFTLSFSS